MLPEADNAAHYLMCNESRTSAAENRSSLASEMHTGFALATPVQCSSQNNLLQASFDAAMAQKQALEDDATATQRKMDSANALLSALAGEEGRWTQQSKEFDDTIQKLTGMLAP